MSPYPADPVRAVGPMRLVLTTYPSEEAATRAVGAVLRLRLAACANLVPVASHYWWKRRVESAHEILVLFKTGPKRVGALLRYLKESHPYRVPEVAELDVPRADAAYLAYLAETIAPSGGAGPLEARLTRRAAPRARAARRPGRTRARPRPRSR